MLVGDVYCVIDAIEFLEERDIVVDDVLDAFKNAVIADLERVYDEEYDSDNEEEDNAAGATEAEGV